MDQRPIVVATLNYCDIMNNPFEFYCQDFEKQLVQISQIFVRLLPLYFPDFKKEKFAWTMGKIDQKIRVGRYSPSFAIYVGIKNDGFMNKQEFQAKWDEVFDQLPLTKELPHTQAERQTTRLYDFVLYHTLLAFAFKKDDFQELIKNPPDLYLDIYRPFYELSFLSQQKKLNKFLGSFTKLDADVFLVQQYSPLLISHLEKTNRYHIVSDDAKDKLIIARKSVFKTKKPIKDVLTEEQIKDLSWSEGPAILISDNYFIINAHLSSKAQKNKLQLAHMKESLLALQSKFPNYSFIVGGDINSFMGHDPNFEKVFRFYPENQSDLTTIKKRTMTQGQYHKGNKVVAESKDKIISNLKIQNGSIRFIDNSDANSKSLIPTDEHPFDHFVLVVCLKRP